MDYTYDELQVGDECYARWSEDEVWYRARVLELLDTGDYKVLFLDYGNQDIVRPGAVVQKAEDIPKNQELDENVVVVLNTNKNTEAVNEPTKESCPTLSIDVANADPIQVLGGAKPKSSPVLWSGDEHESSLAKPKQQVSTASSFKVRRAQLFL